MNKKCFIRFFENKDDQVPTNSFTINDPKNEWCDDKDIGEWIREWMVKHPEGKTDSVWL